MTAVDPPSSTTRPLGIERPSDASQKDEALVLSRPPRFVAGTARIALEAIVSQLFDNGDAKIETSLGSFLIRPPTTSAKTLEMVPLLVTGGRIVLNLSPLGTSARIESTLLPVLDDTPDISVTRTLAPATIAPLRAHTSSGIRDLATGPANEEQIATLRRTSPRRNETGSSIGPDIANAFKIADSLEKISPAEQIRMALDTLPEPYRTLSEELSVIAPLIPALLNAYAPQLSSKFGLSLFLFLLNMRHGGLRHWLDLGNNKIFIDTYTDDIIDYVEWQAKPRTIPVQGHGEWSVTLVPFIDVSIKQMIWATCVDDKAGYMPSHTLRFALQIPLSQIGPIQITGYFDDSHLELVLLAISPLLGPIEQQLYLSAAEACRFHGIEGCLQLSNNTDLWIPFFKALRLDGEI